MFSSYVSPTPPPLPPSFSSWHFFKGTLVPVFLQKGLGGSALGQRRKALSAQKPAWLETFALRRDRWNIWKDSGFRTFFGSSRSSLRYSHQRWWFPKVWKFTWPDAAVLRNQITDNHQYFHRCCGISYWSNACLLSRNPPSLWTDAGVRFDNCEDSSAFVRISFAPKHPSLQAVACRNSFI